MWEDVHGKWHHVFSSFHLEFFWRKHEMNKTLSKMMRDQVVIFESRNGADMVVSDSKGPKFVNPSSRVLILLQQLFIFYLSGWIAITLYACGTGSRASTLWLAFTPSLQFLLPGLALTRFTYVPFFFTVLRLLEVSCVACTHAPLSTGFSQIFGRERKMYSEELSTEGHCSPQPWQATPCVFWFLLPFVCYFCLHLCHLWYSLEPVVVFSLSAWSCENYLFSLSWNGPVWLSSSLFCQVCLIYG